jgi:adenosylhomocysteine nucleosidase
VESAAVAQVCAERSIPFAVFRLISDRADDDASIDSLAFVSSVSAPFAAGIVEEYLSDLG